MASEFSVKLPTGEVVNLDDYIRRAVSRELDRKKTQQQNTRIANASSIPQQSRQWDFLIIVWAILAILSSLSAILSGILTIYGFPYVLAIIQAAVFVGAILGFFVGAFRYIILALFLMLYMFAAFLLTTFYGVALLADFYDCNSNWCAEWRLFLYDVNYIVNIIVAALTFLVTRACWIIITQHRKLTSANFENQLRAARDASKKID